MSIDELLRHLNIDEEPEENENGSWTIELENSNEFDRYDSKLRKSDLLEEDQEASSAGFPITTIQYVSNEETTDDNFVITIMGNFDLDEYKLIIRELDN